MQRITNMENTNPYNPLPRKTGAKTKLAIPNDVHVKIRGIYNIASKQTIKKKLHNK